MTADLRKKLPDVLAETGLASESSLNAKIGGKAAEFIDLHHDVILSPDQYVTLYMKGFKNAMSPPESKFKNTHRENFEIFRLSPAAQEYFILFLKRSYLNHFTELSRVRPDLSQSEIWIGQNKADYGLLITPRFVNGAWQNDRSEIRHFPKLYWTVGHVLQSGLVVQGDPDKIEFPDVKSYLTFFKNSLVRASGSPYEKAIAQSYVDFVNAASDPESVPLLIPEYRYEGAASKHKYRLDFCIIDPFTMQKVGYELSPWSTHGYLSKIGGLTQAKINEMAKDNFEKEMNKHRSFFKKHGIYALIYTDSQLANISEVFDDMKQYLEPVDKVVQLDFHLLEKFFV
ncbi:topoisomerase II [Salinarimonas soli]|uniref:Topoisomerase II n=2 Tax=Salinarimonas soli TaxID=1638099 RepID=A0A5B2VAZ8_9HYPH|nr:topoisomerase II [Salinarimonas soli]